MNYIDYMIEEMAQKFLYEGNTALYGSEEWQCKAIELAKENINNGSFVIEKNTPTEILALLDNKITDTTDISPEEPEFNVIYGFPEVKNIEIRSLSETIDKPIEESEFEFIEGFPAALNDKSEQIHVNELESDTKPSETESVKNDYVSKQFTDEFIEGLKNTEINLIGAECGSGKTSAIFEKLVPYAEKHDNKILYLCNRTTLRKQLIKVYAEGAKDQVLIKINDTLTIGMYQSINAKISFDIPVNKLIESTYDYVVIDEFHSLYDNSDYDYKSYLFMNFLNEINSTIIALTGTPDNIDEMQEFLNKPINKLREPDKTNNRIKNIYVVNNMDKLRQIQNKHLENGYKVLELNSNIESIKKAKNDFNEYKANGLISQSHKEYWKYKNDDDEAIRAAIIDQEKMCCNVLATTKFMDVGINIQADTNFLVTFNCTEIPNTIEQYRSRVRFNKKADYHMDLVFRVLTKQSMYLKMKKIEKEFDTYNELMKKYGSFESIMNHNPAKKVEGFKDKSKVDDWERFNLLRMKFLKTKYKFLKKLYYSKNIIELATQMLQKMYPKAIITVIEYSDLFNVENYFNNLLNGSNEIAILKNQKEQIKNDLKALKLDKKHPNNPVGLDRIKDFFKDNHLPFKINNARPTINGEQQSAWILERLMID
ncbi:DEAD/DEAH box helicase family protein [Rummeliibacillus pycnus]|uniref:DEAD/DEAH box helicase family protein n=1 Tax=Rummeliibacillus pycnus TaxID=101070 RepID=UPI003D2DF353